LSFLASAATKSLLKNTEKVTKREGFLDVSRVRDKAPRITGWYSISTARVVYAKYDI
jgi:hypothetical protein